MPTIVVDVMPKPEVLDPGESHRCSAARVRFPRVFTGPARNVSSSPLKVKQPRMFWIVPKPWLPISKPVNRIYCQC